MTTQCNRGVRVGVFSQPGLLLETFLDNSFEACHHGKGLVQSQAPGNTPGSNTQPLLLCLPSHLRPEAPRHGVRAAAVQRHGGSARCRRGCAKKLGGRAAAAAGPEGLPLLRRPGQSSGGAPGAGRAGGALTWCCFLCVSVTDGLWKRGAPVARSRSDLAGPASLRQHACTQRGPAPRDSRLCTAAATGGGGRCQLRVQWIVGRECRALLRHPRSAAAHADSWRC